jgi:hypothetical protein
MKARRLKKMPSLLPSGGRRRGTVRRDRGLDRLLHLGVQADAVRDRAEVRGPEHTAAAEASRRGEGRSPGAGNPVHALCAHASREGRRLSDRRRERRDHHDKQQASGGIPGIVSNG